ncbi:TetR/AcrR family transcriptional regulator C-terminal domain-containing protein [Micromonospora vinacea]|uniref:TetR/AcrR family transcriptional regulator C-terminal domain-containing protein n=1 Tax=Micromonospora vinacea TaxID=709878 RepID=UPI0034570142
MVRARYTLDDIRSEALRLVDRDGLAALNMRSLATALGTGPMTLYNYVRDREGLEELVVDAVISAVDLPPSTSDWRHDTIQIATATWRAVRAHPAAIPLVLTRRSTSAAGFAPAEALIAALRRSALGDRDLLAAFRAVLGLIMGSAQAELAGPLIPPEATAEDTATRIGALAGQDFPHIEALSHVSQRSSPEADFTRGLKMLVAGIAAV